MAVCRGVYIKREAEFMANLPFHPWPLPLRLELEVNKDPQASSLNNNVGAPRTNTKIVEATWLLFLFMGNCISETG